MSQLNPIRNYTPALSYHCLTPLYDGVVAVFTREHKWRPRFVDLVDPQPGETILDIGCGTGSTALALKQRCPEARIIGIDPDPRVLNTARKKADRRRLEIELHVGYGQAPPAILQGTRFTKITSSLVLHHIHMDHKHQTFAAARTFLGDRGVLFLADFGQQRSRLMRHLFRIVQVCDGFEATGPHADGQLPGIMAAAGFTHVEELEAIRTPIGSISLFRASTLPPANSASTRECGRPPQANSAGEQGTAGERRT